LRKGQSKQVELQMQRMGLYFFILLFFGSCTPKIFVGLDSSGKKRIQKSDLYPLIVDTTLMYNMVIRHQGIDLSGILLIKPVDEHSVRMLFTSDFGLTIFDFELNETEFKIDDCFPPLQEKRILDLFRRDFRALFSYHFPEEIEAEVYEKELVPTAYKIKTTDGTAYFLVQDKQLKKIEMPAAISSLQIDYQNYKNNLPESIFIMHPRLKLNMQLERVTQE